MGNPFALQPHRSREEEWLCIASCLLIEANRTLRDTQILVAIVLRYALMGVCISNGLIDLMTASTAEEPPGWEPMG